MAGLQAGRLRHRVRIEAKTRVANGQGGSTVAWTLVAIVRAEIIGLSGDEALKAGVERSVQQWRVTIRTRAVTTQNRLVYLDADPTLPAGPCDIKAVLPDPRAEGALVLMCETGVAKA